VLAALFLSMGCDPSVEFSVVNESETAVCLFPTQADALEGRLCNEVTPGETRSWRLGCGEADHLPRPVLIASRPDGEIIYSRTEECGVWKSSDRQLVVRQDGDRLFVEDGLDANATATE
jgi:hypothetical protein